MRQGVYGFRTDSQGLYAITAIIDSDALSRSLLPANTLG